MGFLADVGRSNLLGQVMQYGQFVRQGEQMRRQEAVTNQALQKGAIELEDAKKKFEALHKKQPFEASILYQTTPEELRPGLMKAAREGGYSDDKGMSMFDRNRMMEESAAFQKIWFTGQEAKAQQMVEKAISGFENAQLSGDQEKIQRADAIMRAALARLAAVKNQASSIPGILGGEEGKPPSSAQEFVLAHPEFEGKEGTPEFGKAYEKYLYEKAQRINQILPIYMEGGKIVGYNTRGVEKGKTEVSDLPDLGGGVRTPVRPTAPSEGDIQSVTSVTNITEVLPQVKKTLDMRLQSGTPLTNQVTGRIWDKQLSMGVSAGVPQPVVETYEAIKHLKVWATGILKGQGSDEQRRALEDTLPKIWDSPQIMVTKMKRTLQISRNVLDKRLAAMRAGNKAIPPEFYSDLYAVDNFIAELENAKIGTGSPSGGKKFKVDAQGNVVEVQ